LFSRAQETLSKELLSSLGKHSLIIFSTKALYIFLDIGAIDLSNTCNNPEVISFVGISKK